MTVILHHDKHGISVYKNLRTMFESIDSRGYYYIESEMSVDELDFYRKAKAGDDRYLEWFLDIRNNREYERWQEEAVV